MSTDIRKLGSLIVYEIKRNPIVRNAVRCKLCNDVIESTHRHDFKYCKCGAVFVDGGPHYKRRGWHPGYDPDDVYEELGEFYGPENSNEN